MHGEDVRRAVVEFVAAGRIQDAIDCVQEYVWGDTKDGERPVSQHLKNRIKKLERLGIVCAMAELIVLDGDIYRTFIHSSANGA